LQQFQDAAFAGSSFNCQLVTYKHSKLLTNSKLQ